MLSSLSPGKPTMNGNVHANPVTEALLGALEHLVAPDVLPDPLEHLVGARLDADQDPAQP